MSLNYYFFMTLLIKVVENVIKPLIFILSMVFKFLCNCKKEVFSFVTKSDHIISIIMQYFWRKNIGPSRGQYFDEELKTSRYRKRSLPHQYLSRSVDPNIWNFCQWFQKCNVPYQVDLQEYQYSFFKFSKN